MMPFKIGPMELIIILVIVMMIFGVGKLPQVGNSIGKALREFRKAQNADVLEEAAASDPILRDKGSRKQNAEDSV